MDTSGGTQIPARVNNPKACERQNNSAKPSLPCLVWIRADVEASTLLWLRRLLAPFVESSMQGRDLDALGKPQP